MKVEVFDDVWSLIHTVLGVLTLIFPLIFVLFIFYEFIEFILKRPKEKFEFFIGDILEYSLGLTFTSIFLTLL
ncbi:MAG: hypothetical protein ACKD6N_03540 [Candidatus Bathyarchaeota archaeon]